MKRPTVGAAVLVALAACSDGAVPTDAPLVSEPATLETSVPTTSSTSPLQPPEGVRFWELAELIRGSGYSEFLEVSTMSAGIYSLPSASEDAQSPHGEDEVYYVLEGEATLAVKGEHIPVGPGSIVYVRAGAVHRFEPITADIRTVVLFSSTPTDPGASTSAAFELSDMREGSASGNSWNQFLTAPTLRFGLYRLPASSGGDDPLVHTFDEINFVVSGRGLFRVEEFDLPIGPGSVMFVPATLPHSFHSLSEDLDVLIFWEGGN